jgi:hypothetical protein
MSNFLQDSCYESAVGSAACIEFHLDRNHRRGFNVSQLIDYSLDPNPEAETDRNEPPQKLSITFSTADVVILGWRLDFLANKLRDNSLMAVGLLPKRYAELERNPVFVSAIKIEAFGNQG